jgi:iron complex outermembrane receptor protein
MKNLMGARRARLLCVAAGCAVVLAIGSAHAEGVASSAITRESIGLEEIVVTARKREENIQSVPATITAFSADQLTQSVIVRADDLQNVVPTLRVAASKGGGRDSPNYALRGLRSSGVVLYMSDIPVSGPAVDRALFDLASVQVLPGPQGTLFGKNTTAGAILFQPARPSANFEGSVEARGGDYAMYGGEGMINVPLSEKLMLRVATEFTNREGYTTVVTPTRSFATFDGNQA